MIARWVVGVVLLFGILLFMLPKTDDESIAKIASASMLMCTQEVRKEVENRVINQEAIESEFSIKCPDLIATLELNEQGEIMITGKEHPLKMTLSPVLENGGVRWSCLGEPAEVVTKLCKP